MLLIWDNFETVRELPDPTGVTPPLDATEQRRMLDFLQAVAREGKSGVIITSRTPENWLGDVRRVELRGLTPNEASEMAEDVLRPYAAGRAKRNERSFGELMEWLEGHPLSMRLLLPQLETVSAASLVEALKGNTEVLPPGFVGEGRLASLGASLKYSFDHIAADGRKVAIALSLFEKVVNEDLLSLLSTMSGVPARFAGVAQSTWPELLCKLAETGVLTKLGGKIYGLHPSLPSYLLAEWRQIANQDFAAELEGARYALLRVYAALGHQLMTMIQRGAVENAFSVISWERNTLGQLLGFALERHCYAEANSLITPLYDFLEARGLRPEARRWLERCRDLVEDDQGNPPALNSPSGTLWLSAVELEANQSLLTGDYDAAYQGYTSIRKLVESGTDFHSKKVLMTVYHYLGKVSQDRNNGPEASKWLQQALKIEKKLLTNPNADTHQIEFQMAETYTS